MADTRSPGSGGAAVSMEFMARRAAAEQILQRYIEARPPEADPDDVNIRWGKAANFTIADPIGLQPPSGGTVTVIWPEDDEDEEEEEEEAVPTYVFNEVERTTTTIRVENPDDPDDYVMIKRIESITFQGPEGFYQFNLKNDPA